MRGLWLIGLALGAALSFSPAKAGKPAFDPRSLRTGMAGPPTQVMVLGSMHLSQLPATWPASAVEPLLDKLARFKPDIITIEGVSGASCEQIRRYRAIYPGVAEPYCLPTDIAEHATGLSIPAATAEVEAKLAAWPTNPTPAQRRRLAAAFLAAGDSASALVQWLRLPPSERRAGDGVDEPLRQFIDGRATRRNESYMVGAALAVRLGLERVYPVDDHTADSISATLGPAYEEALHSMWDVPSAYKDAYRAREAKITTGADLLNEYRIINQPESLRAAMGADFVLAAKQQTPQLYGRQYLAWWETRNLRMVANIRAAYGNHPGARVLAIVGASHKPYFESYLNMMHDVDIVDVEPFLK